MTQPSHALAAFCALLAVPAYAAAQDPGATPPLIKALDKDGDGAISMAELRGVALKDLDTDKNGSLSVEELVGSAGRRGGRGGHVRLRVAYT